MTIDLIREWSGHLMLWIITALLAYAAKSIADLNRNVALLLQSMVAHGKTLDDHEGRIRAVEHET